MKTLFFLIKVGKVILKVLLGIVGIALFVASLQYFTSNIYKFPEPRPFSGDHFYNPYEDLSGKWYKANFHAHAKTWGGLTDGKQSGESLIRKYDSLGYDIIGISDYHSINVDQNFEDPLFIPVYEHGYNLKKSHRLAIGSKEVSFFDIALFQGLSHKQYLINRVKRTSPYVAIAHPLFFHGHKVEDFKYLSGFDLIEVLNHFRISDKHWDMALSSGKAAWILADDDTHDISSPKETGVMWTMIQASEGKATVVLNALASGSAYGVKGKGAFNDNYLKNVSVESDTLTIMLEKPAEKIALIGQGGLEKVTVRDKHTVRYTFQPDDTYIRAVIENENSTMYLNPVIRYDGINTPKNMSVAQINYVATWSVRFGIILIYILFGVFLYKRYIRKAK